MRIPRTLKIAAQALALSAALGLGSGAAIAQIKVGVIYSGTGATSFVGIPQGNTIALLPQKIGDYTVQYIGLDDASDPTQTVTNVRKLIDEQKIDALIGPSGSPNAMGVIQFIAEAGIPMLAPVGTAAVVQPMDDKKKWVFKTTQNDEIIGAALFDYMSKSGVKTIGFIGLSDPYGENWYRVSTGLAEKHGIKIIANERFARTDASVTGQTLKLIGAKPDAVLIAAAGGPTVLPEVSLRDRGYKGPIYQTHGAALPAFIKLGGAKVEGTIMAASLMLVLPEIADSNPSKKIAQNYIDEYKKRYGEPPATFGANVFDAGLLLQNAIPKAAEKGKPGTPEFRAALRDALEQTKELVGTQGVYNMTPEDHSGFDQRGRELITVKDGQFRLLK
ncbi:MAG: branched-chain amino acid ABC transporter substrate-binding protein [Burkholderiales bacterium 66-5]|uniref:ABC transporter substrate-binding protein n=1 Tax=Comamonas badia TaxID=265291 RepID=UPI0003FF5E44|nr:ABC transporter substrate-binding protein [Comamonas badia]OJU91467.1 MAG: branched-chain amino acid ABC transporter substrate-binding protein [Burkholderiales bacterium 66-5]